MTGPASLTPVGDRLSSVFGGEHSRGTTHSAGCASWHVLCAYQAGRAEGLAVLAADLQDEASDVARQPEPPWGAMYGLEVTSGAEAARILMRARELALRRAERSLSVPGDPSAMPP